MTALLWVVGCGLWVVGCFSVEFEDDSVPVCIGPRSALRRWLLKRSAIEKDRIANFFVPTSKLTTAKGPVLC